MCNIDKISESTRNKVHFSCVLIMLFHPFICGVLFWIHTLFLLFGVNIHVAEFIGSCSLFVFTILLIASYAYDFCLLHRLFLVYNYIMSICIDYQEYVGFGSILYQARVTMCIIGVILILSFVYYRKEFLYVRKRTDG